MAYQMASNQSPLFTDGSNKFTNVVANAKASYAAWNKRRKTFAELNSLSDRELADIGIVRADIANVAAGVAY